MNRRGAHLFRLGMLILLVPMHHVDARCPHPPSWSSDGVFEAVVKRSSGQFIYTSTVVKYLSSLYHQPADCLNAVFGIRPPSHAHEVPFGELNALYSRIFSSVEDVETVLLILGFYLLIISAYAPNDGRWGSRTIFASGLRIYRDFSW